MKDLTSPHLMYVKAVLFLIVGAVACAIILIDHPSLKVAALLVLAIWGFARAYYFAFYVIGHYIDPSFQFAGLTSVARYLPRRQRPRGTSAR
jgi:hypothetical protein